MTANTVGELVEWTRLTPPRVIVLAELAAFHTEREAARKHRDQYRWPQEPCPRPEGHHRLPIVP